MGNDENLGTLGEGKGEVFFRKPSTSWGMRRVWKEFPTAANVEPDPSAMICGGVWISTQHQLNRKK